MIQILGMSVVTTIMGVMDNVVVSENSSGQEQWGGLDIWYTV